MERIEAKLLALLLISVLSFLSTIAPYKLSSYVQSKGAKGKQLLSCLMCFGGGVFLATFMLHMGPDVRHILHKYLAVPHHINYPIADLIMACGFFFVLYVEKLASKWNARRQTRKTKRRVLTNHIAIDNNKQPSLTRNASGTITEIQNGGHYHSNSSEADRKVFAGVITPLLKSDTVASDSESAKTNQNEIIITVTEDFPDFENIRADLHSTRSLILMLALSLHRIFEGMGVGLQQTTQSVFNLITAVICHEVVIGFSLGLDFMKNNFTLRRWLVTSVVCSSIMPVGIIVGIAMTETGHQSNGLQIANGILQALTCGTFIYVTFMEILHDELDILDTGLSRTTSLLMGFVLMALLSLVPEQADVAFYANVTLTTDLSGSLEQTTSFF